MNMDFDAYKLYILFQNELVTDNNENLLKIYKRIKLK